MTADQMKQAQELILAYAHVDMRHHGYPERTTAAEVLVRAAANEVVFARWRHPAVREWKNKLPCESATTVGNYLKALRTGAEDEFVAKLGAITDPEIRRVHLLCANARYVFLDAADAMRNVDEVLHAIDLAMSYD
ncbi:MAG TPA: hypothetical protein PLI17_10190 [Denitromonas sp.]|nr:hypothetical protein [Denitromonas sp.]